MMKSLNGKINFLIIDWFILIEKYDVVNLDDMKLGPVSKFKNIGSAITDEKSMKTEITERLGWKYMFLQSSGYL